MLMFVPARRVSDLREIVERAGGEAADAGCPRRDRVDGADKVAVAQSRALLLGGQDAETADVAQAGAGPAQGVAPRTAALHAEQDRAVALAIAALNAVAVDTGHALWRIGGRLGSCGRGEQHQGEQAKGHVGYSKARIGLVTAAWRERVKGDSRAIVCNKHSLTM